MWNFIKGLFKGALVAASYHSLKKVIDRYPNPYKGIIIFFLRLSVFFIIFLSLFSFFTGRIYSIAANVQGPSVVINIIVGICFILSVIISFLLTAVIEEIYRKLSEMKLQAQKNMEAMHEKAQAPARMIKGSVRSTKDTLSKTGHLIGESSRKIYDVSSKITDAAMDASVTGIKRIFNKFNRKKKKDAL